MATRTVYVLCYHRILASDKMVENRPYFARGSAVSESAFRQHLQEIQSRFECLTQAHALAVIRGETDLARPGCWITFDDAYLDVWERAVPLLSEFGLVATAFVSTAVLDGAVLPADRWYAVLSTARRRKGLLTLPGSPPWPYDLDASESYSRFIDGPEKRDFLRSPAADQERLLCDLADALKATATSPQRPLYMSTHHLKSLVERGWEIGSHSVSHPILTGLDAAGQRNEIGRSRVVLKQALGVTPRCFAYPDGAWDHTVARRVRKAGYDAAVVLHNRTALPATDTMAIPRFLATNKDDWVGSLLADAGARDQHG